MAKRELRAEARTRLVPIGMELRFYVTPNDGEFELLWSKICATAAR